MGREVAHAHELLDLAKARKWHEAVIFGQWPRCLGFEQHLRGFLMFLGSAVPVN